MTSFKVAFPADDVVPPQAPQSENATHIRTFFEKQLDPENFVSGWDDNGLLCFFPINGFHRGLYGPPSGSNWKPVATSEFPGCVCV